TPDMSVGNALTGEQGQRRAPTRRAAKSGPSSKLLASRACARGQVRVSQTNSAWSLAPSGKRTRGSNRPLLEPDPTGLPADSALIVLERGPHAGSRFLLDQPVTSVGRPP